MTSVAASAESERTTLRVESAAVYVATAAGIIGAAYGLVVALVLPDAPLRGDWSFGVLAALAGAAVAALVSGVGYWRSRNRPGQQWRHALAPWKVAVNTTSVVIVHTALAAIAVYVIYLVLSLGFIGLNVVTFWAVVLMAVTLGLTAYVVFLSVARMTTQRMSSLLMAFVAIGTLTSMVTTPDAGWWKVHFSQLGTFDDLSSALFNGTLIAGGLLVTTFAVYIANDLEALVARRGLSSSRTPLIVSVCFVVMGIMLACVGIFPVDVNEWLHNLSASGMAVMYLALLIGGATWLKGMPRAYFLSSWAFLAALVVSVFLFAIAYFSLTAFEIVVFALIFGWIAVFIRFLGVAEQKVDVEIEQR